MIPPIPPEVRARIVQLRRGRCRLKQIALETGVSMSAVSRILQQEGLGKPPKTCKHCGGTVA